MKSQAEMLPHVKLNDLSEMRKVMRKNEIDLEDMHCSFLLDLSFLDHAADRLLHQRVPSGPEHVPCVGLSFAAMHGN